MANCQNASTVLGLGWNVETEYPCYLQGLGGHSDLVEASFVENSNRHVFLREK